ncbi:DUF4349 domain-containing protein [Streptomyces sp. NPDC052236]|uniref:DUF4349 domain-containing protein n=1 Tax=Streptomyces sp. NPDC052236 TaxID=3365686 RepID=UPI0037D40771
MRARRTCAALLLTVSLGVAGCSGANDSGSTADEKAAQSGAQPAAEDAARAEGSGSLADAGAPSAPSGRQQAEPKNPVALPTTHIIRTATISVEVEDAPKALAKARTAAEDAGGHVSNESTERLDDTHVTSHVVLRVPQEKYDAVLTELAGAGKLLSRKADAKDVTGQVVDVDSRIATQRASVARVRALMDRATQLSDVVTLEGQLSSRQAELESLLAQQASLKDRTTLATITVDLTEKEGPEPKKDEDEDPGFLDALNGGWDALVTAVKWIGIVIAAIAPWVAAFGLLFALWWWVIRPRLARRTAAAPAQWPVPAPAPAPAPGSGTDPGQD